MKPKTLSAPIETIPAICTNCQAKDAKARGLCSRCLHKERYTPHPAVKRVLHNANISTVWTTLSPDLKRAVWKKVLKHRRVCREMEVPTSDQFVREAVIDAANGCLDIEIEA